MRLPHAEHALVSLGKVTGYLLSESHPVGRHKSRWFRSLGFSHPLELARALVAVARTGGVIDALDSAFGRRYIVDGWLSRPSGRVIGVRTVWIIVTGTATHQLVTAYPRQRQR